MCDGWPAGPGVGWSSGQVRRLCHLRLAALPGIVGIKEAVRASFKKSTGDMIVPLKTQINGKLKLQTPETVTAAPLLEI